MILLIRRPTSTLEHFHLRSQKVYMENFRSLELHATFVPAYWIWIVIAKLQFISRQ